MRSEFYYIDEEFFSEDNNDSTYCVLDDLIFTSEEEAEKYLEEHFTKNDYQSLRKEFLHDGKCCFVITDESFPEKYSSSLGESYEKYFFIKKLTLFK